MEDKNYLQDIRDIKDLMNRSTQFISLSGLSGVLAGIYALGGAFVAKSLISRADYSYSADGYRTSFDNDTHFQLIALATAVLLLSVATALLMTSIKAKKMGQSLLNSTSKRLAVNFAIPLVTGGIFALMLLKNENYDLIAPVTLIFYGMACVNASKYTFRDVRYLGLTTIALGLICIEFFGYGLEFWALGFGVSHIVYGGIMHFKYDRGN